MDFRLDLKIACIRRCGSQLAVSRELGISESKLSHLINGHVEPTDQEKKTIKEKLGYDFDIVPDPPLAP